MNNDFKKSLYLFGVVAILVFAICLLTAAYQNYKEELLFDYGRWAEAEITDLIDNKKNGCLALYLIKDGGEEYIGEQFIRLDHPVVIGDKYPVLYYTKAGSRHCPDKNKLTISKMFFDVIK